MSKVSLFIDRFVAFVKGDDEGVLAAKVKGQAISAFESSIASYKGDTSDFKEAVTLAKEEVEKSLINYGVAIGKGAEGRAAYIKVYLDKINALTKAEEALEIHEKRIGILEAGIAKID